MANVTPHLLPRGERLLQGAIADLLSDSATEIEVNNPPSVDELPTYFELAPDTDNAETIRVYDVSGNTIYFERGVYSSGVGTEHLPNTPYKQKITSQHWKKTVDAIEQGYLSEDDSLTIVRDSASQFTVEGVDRTSLYTEGRVLRFNGSDANIAIVESSNLATSDTEVTLKSGTVPNPLTKVELAIGARGANNLTALISALQAGSYQYAADSGAADAYVVDLDPDVTAYTAGMAVVFKAANANTTASTVNVNSLGTKTIKKNVTDDLEAGDIVADQIVVLIYDGTNFQLVGGSGSSVEKATGAELDTGTDDAKFATAKAIVDSKMPSSWVPGRATWVYASASTFTIAGVDLTSVYVKGTRLRFKQGGGYKYAVVLSSSFSTNTTVTIAVNTDYTIANATITDNDYSYAAQPPGYPNWFAFTPTWSGFSVNPGGTCKFNIVGNLVVYSLYGGTGTSNSTSFTMTLPVPIASYYVGSFCVGSQIGVDNGASVIAYATCGSTTRLDFYKSLALGGWTGSGNKGIQMIVPFELG